MYVIWSFDHNVYFNKIDFEFGFYIDEHGQVIKGSKVNLPKSSWIELSYWK